MNVKLADICNAGFLTNFGICTYYIYFPFSSQRQIAHNIKFGKKPPSVRKSEGDEGSSDEEEVPKSPLRVLAQVEPEPPETETREQVSKL